VEETKEYLMIQNNISYKRINARQHLKRDCFLSSEELGLVNCKSVDISKGGLGVIVDDETIPIQKGNIMFVHLEGSMHDISRAEVKWTRKDNNATRVGLKLPPKQLY